MVSTGTVPQYGLICDRTSLGLGRVLLLTQTRRERVDVETPCGIEVPHRHEVVVRMVTSTDWEPLGGIGNFVSGGRS